MLNPEDENRSTERLGHRVRIELCTKLLAEGRPARFPAELEFEYLEFHAQRVFAMLRLALLLVPFIYLSLFVVDYCFDRRLQTPIALGLCFGVGVPLSLVLLWLVYRPEKRSGALRFAPWCTLINGLVVISVNVEATINHQPLHYEALAVVFAYVFFLCGLLPRAAYAIAATQIIVYGAGEFLAGLPAGILAFHLWFLLTMGTLGAMGLWMLDRSQRRFWLQNVLTTELSISDGLTGLHNHRHLKEQGDIVLRHAGRELRQAALLLIDVDYFKSYNDNQGHLAGDECLRRIATAIETTGRRPLDVAARYGGEEFAVLMYDCVEPQAMRHAEQLRDTINRMRIPHPGSPFGFITVSIGVTSGIPALTAQLETFSAAADIALYAAKAGGRNRVESGLLAR